MGSDGLHRYTRAILRFARENSITAPNSPTIKAMDEFIRGLDSSGIWGRCDVFYIGAYNDLSLAEFSRINWISPNAHLLGSTATSLFTLNGWKFDGVEAINTNYRTLDAVKLTLNNAHQAALVYEVPESPTATNTIIAGNQTNGIDRWSAFNTNLQRINANVSIDSNANLSGVGFKTINRKSATDVVLTSGATTIIRTGASYQLQIQNHVIGANSTNRSQLGIATFSMGAAIDDLVPTYRSLLNDYLYQIGLPAIA